MLTVDDYGAIRRARRDGLSIRAIARRWGHTRKTVRQVLAHAEPPPITRARKRVCPRLGPVQGIIDQILQEDEDAPPKQRHTAAQLFRRLHDEFAYTGGYAQVQRYVRQHRRRQRETFIPLGHLPGRRLEADFGHIHVDFPDGRRLVPFLVTTWAYSNAPFVVAMPFERTEAILEGMVTAFEFFGMVPKEVWWDNPRTVATWILQGRERRLHPRYAALASHYVFDPLFCMPARGNEKPDAESTVKAVPRRFATPVPRVADLDELNAYFRQRCDAERTRTVQSRTGPFLIGARFEEERAVATPLPEHRFDPCVVHPAVAVDKYQTVAFETNRYSVPRSFAFDMVSVKGYVDEVVIVAKGQVIARHQRSHARQTMVLDPLHYVAALAHKPGAFDHAPVFRNWQLPACFTAFRAELEQQHGTAGGGRRFASLLQLMTEHPMSRVAVAIEECQKAQLIRAEAVIRRTRVLGVLAAPPRGDAVPACDTAARPQVHVPLPDLGCFDLLLGGRDDSFSSNQVSLNVMSGDQATEAPVSVIFA